MQVKATARYVRVAPNKARQVVTHIRGLGVADARRILQFSPKGVSEQILKTLNSAVANAEHNEELDADDLFVEAAVVDEGPTIKRFQPRAMGRAYRIRKRTSHITITLGVRELAPAAPRAGAKASRAEKRTAVAAAKSDQRNAAEAKPDKAEEAARSTSESDAAGTDAAGEKE